MIARSVYLTQHGNVNLFHLYEWVADEYTCEAGSSNPCTAANIAAGLLYHSYDDDARYFIQCDVSGGCHVLPCREGTVWDQQRRACSATRPVTIPACASYTDGKTSTSF